MALLKCDRTQDVPLITQKSETLADFSFSTYTHEFHPLSANGSLRGKCKEITGNEIPFSLTTNVLSRSVLLQGNKCVDRTVEFTPSAKRLHMSCSASVSPKKSMTISKRQGRSQSSSPYGKLCSRTLADTSNDSNFIRLHKSNGNDWTTSDSSPTVTSPNIFSDGAFDFTMCDQCSELRTTSLDSWMDHLGQSHPLPLHWPSSRAANLNEHEKKYPYTTVIGSNKKRKATAIPRPLNSFMIFAQYLRRIVLHWFPDAPNVHISQRVGQLWRKLDSKMRHKYIDEAYRLQQLHAIEFPDYKYQPKKRTRVGNGTVNNNENDELISKSENVPIKSKSVTLSNNNNDSKCSPVNYENIKFSISQNCFTRLNHREYNDDHHPHHTPSAPQKLEETNIRSATCNRDYFQSCLQLNNKLNIELQQSMVGCVSDQYDTRVFLSPNLKDSLIFKENKEINETMTLLVSDGDKVENGVTYQLHKIIPCHTIDGVAPSSLNYGSQIKEIRIVNMQSPTVQQVLNKQPILCHTVLCEPLKTTVIRRPTIVPIRTNTSVLNGLLLDANLNNPNFQPITTQSTVTVTPSLSSNSSSIIGLDYNIPHSDSTSEIEFENVHSQYTSISNKHKSNVINYSSEGVTVKHTVKDVCAVDYKMVGNNNDSISGSREFTIADDIHLCGFDELDAERFDTLSNHRQNISSFSENVKLKCEGDDVDMVLSFNDIDTSKSGASLDELEQITLFPCEMTNDFLHLRDGSNTKLSAVSKTDNMDNCEPAISSPTQSVICTNTLTQINSLPSIESWTFGTSKSL